MRGCSVRAAIEGDWLALRLDAQALLGRRLMRADAVGELVARAEGDRVGVPSAAVLARWYMEGA